jgi:colanic acid/amylovoran biosynthesis glycosyltransferase
MSNILHFVRKNTQLKASFINNQISHHIDWKAFVIYREQRFNPVDGGFAEFDISNYKYLDLSKDETLFEKYRYKTIKKLSKRQINIILEFICDNKVDVCHFHFGTDCGVYAPLLERLTIPSVVSFYGYDCSSFPKRFYGYGKVYLKRRVFKNITKVLAMSPDMKKDLISSGCPEEKIEVHYYGTDVQRFNNKDKQFKEQEIVTILNLCSLVPQKGQLFLLKSINGIIAKGVTNFRLRIVGTGELEQELNSYVVDNKLQDYVEFVGAIPYGGSDMLREYREADIFVHPSVVGPNGDKEGIPGTIVEAMSAALPVISTNHAGIPYIIINNETGLLVNENDVFALGEAIVLLIKNNDLRKSIGLSGQDFAMRNLDLLKKEIELEEIYSNLK